MFLRVTTIHVPVEELDNATIIISINGSAGISNSLNKDVSKTAIIFFKTSNLQQKKTKKQKSGKLKQVLRKETNNKINTY